MEILKRDSLIESGFAGLKEHRIVKDHKVFNAKASNDRSWEGLGHFIFLADARYMPYGETEMHSHNELDIISVMVDGNIVHHGSLQHGTDITANDVQVQRAGGEGFAHNEVNPDNSWNRMIQIWILPEVAGQASDYKLFKPKPGELTRVYGGNNNDNRFPAKTKVDIALLSETQKLEINEPFIAYITRGTGVLNNQKIEDGDIIRGESLLFEATSNVQLIIIHTGEGNG